MAFAFEDLQVYQKALDFAVAVIDQIEEMDTPRKHYRLIEQLEAACTSVALNISYILPEDHCMKLLQCFRYLKRRSG